jgi:hypothetical protein
MVDASPRTSEIPAVVSARRRRRPRWRCCRSPGGSRVGPRVACCRLRRSRGRGGCGGRGRSPPMGTTSPATGRGPWGLELRLVPVALQIGPTFQTALGSHPPPQHALPATAAATATASLLRLRLDATVASSPMRYPHTLRVISRLDGAPAAVASRPSSPPPSAHVSDHNRETANHQAIEKSYITHGRPPSCGYAAIPIFRTLVLLPRTASEWNETLISLKPSSGMVRGGSAFLDDVASIGRR